ncbi:glycine oxidase ThiO [Bacillus massiliigorillae]|uniref:glycine oxidase ThiO n=1 Tax=Bacillus massiliigorillae TaxID=1243664 RepID=UPI0003A7FE25|nr:glycine oxidase ThiO [Bacillus massiliigorillae]
MKTNIEVAVIGGGIIGCSIAYYLSQAKVDVVLFEEQQIASKTTSAAAGMLGAHSELDEVQTFYSFALKSQLAYQSLQDEIKNISGIDIERKQGGIFQLVYSNQEKETLSSLLSLPTVEWYGAEDVSNHIPSVSPNIIGAAYIKDDVNVLPTSVCRGFAKSAQVLGASILDYTKVLDIKKENNGYTLYTTNGKFQAQYVVIANGVWSSTFLKKLGLNHTLIPVKGECLSVSSNSVPLKHTLFHKQSYIVPRNNGQLVIGATMVKDDWNIQPSIDGIESVISKAKSMLPEVSDMKIESFWAGLRPQTFDGKPFIGQHPEDSHLLFATGHYRNGILLAPATGQMIRNLILQQKVPEDWIEAFKINRKKHSLV